MGIISNLLGTINDVFSLGKDTNKVEFRSSSGTLQGKDNGGSWENILGQGGSSTKEITSVSANYTVQTSDQVILVTTGSSDRTMTLPTAASMNKKELTFKKVDSGTGDVILDGNGSETIDGNLTLTISGQYTYLTFICDGTKWHVIGGFGIWK